MLINEIVLVELKYIPNKIAKVTKMDGRSYNWDVANMRFTDAKTGDVVSNNGSLFVKLIKANPQATKSQGKGVLTRAVDKLGFGKDVAQKAMNDPKASFGQKAGAKVLGGIGKGLDKIGNLFKGKKQEPGPGAGPRDKNVDSGNVNVRDFAQKGDVRTLVDTKGKPLMIGAKDIGMQDNDPKWQQLKDQYGKKYKTSLGRMIFGQNKIPHDFEFDGGKWNSLLTNKPANPDQEENLNAQYDRSTTKNDSSDDVQNLRRQVEQGNLSQEQADQIVKIYQSDREKYPTLNDAYQEWQKSQKSNQADPTKQGGGSGGGTGGGATGGGTMTDPYQGKKIPLSHLSGAELDDQLTQNQRTWKSLNPEQQKVLDRWLKISGALNKKTTRRKKQTTPPAVTSSPEINIDINNNIQNYNADQLADLIAKKYNLTQKQEDEIETKIIDWPPEKTPTMRKNNPNEPEGV